MAGHSKWANIKHRKARQDAVKGKAWSKCSKAIIVAAKNGGPDPDANLTLRYAIDDAKAANMPKDTIEKAIKKGAGELESESYDEIRYEGYGPGGVAVMIDCLTDNLNRTAPEIRKIFERAGGNLGVPGSVSFAFNNRGLIRFDAADIRGDDEDRLMEIALEAGATDIRKIEDDEWEVETEPPDMLRVKEAIIAATGYQPLSAEVTMVPMNTIPVTGKDAQRILKLMETLEEHDDVQKVYANFDISDEELKLV